MNPYGYSETVWRLFQDAPRAGIFSPGLALSAAADVIEKDSVSSALALSASAATPANRSVLTLHLQIEEGCVSDARFQAYGCPTTIAVGAWLAQQAVGRRPEELSGIKAATIRQALEIPDERSHCALLGEDVIQALLVKVKSTSA